MWIAAVASPLILVQISSAARAQSYAMPLFAALVWILARDARNPDRRLLLVIPLLALWANLHGSVLLACALVLLRCAIGAGTALRARRPHDALRFAAPACAALLAPLASPYGFALIDYYRATLTNGAFHELVSGVGRARRCAAGPCSSCSPRSRSSPSCAPRSGSGCSGVSACCCSCCSVSTRCGT